MKNSNFRAYSSSTRVKNTKVDDKKSAQIGLAILLSASLTAFAIGTIMPDDTTYSYEVVDHLAQIKTSTDDSIIIQFHDGSEALVSKDYLDSIDMVPGSVRPVSIGQKQVFMKKNEKHGVKYGSQIFGAGGFFAGLAAGGIGLLDEKRLRR